MLSYISIHFLKLPIRLHCPNTILDGHVLVRFPMQINVTESSFIWNEINLTGHLSKQPWLEKQGAMKRFEFM